MKIRVGYELINDFPRSTPMIMVLGTHFTRASDVIVPDYLTTNPSVPISPYRDVFGNWCSRIVAPAGRIRLWADGVVRDTGLPDVVALRLPNTRWRICRRRRYSFSSVVATARPTTCPRWPGTSSKSRRRGGRASRRYAISSIATLPSATSMRARP
jgi:hypothetical protein